MTQAFGITFTAGGVVTNADGEIVEQQPADQDDKE